MYLSSDSVDEDEGGCTYPPEWLHTLQVSGLPPHELRLKPGVPIILLRNLDAANGLANGTRLIVVSLMPNCIQAEIATGSRASQPCIIPRIPLRPSDSKLPFTLCRHQFPVRAAFAMSINKAQGQTFQRVGIYLPKPCFSHGQLYVAMSRVGAPAGGTIMAGGGGAEQQRQRQPQHQQPQQQQPQRQQPQQQQLEGAATTLNVVYTEVLGHAGT